MEEFLKTSLLALATQFERATGVSPATAAKRALNDNTFFSRIEGGAGFSVRTADRLLQWFSDNWPEGELWPEGLERPPASGCPFAEPGGGVAHERAA
ncbi:MAG: hypothetical protein K2Y29_17960 [Beijerinckiaceae bacterium]|nr:hypothetical protein [Beijerinckiaceae bacterium]